MRNALPSIMVILVCLSNGYCVNTEWVSLFDEKNKQLDIGNYRFGKYVSGRTINDLTSEDIQNIKDAMGVYEKEDEK